MQLKALSLPNFLNSVWKLKFSSRFSTFKLYILCFLAVELFNVFIFFYSFLSRFILSRSINDSDMYKLREPASKIAYI